MVKIGDIVTSKLYKDGKIFELKRKCIREEYINEYGDSVPEEYEDLGIPMPLLDEKDKKIKALEDEIKKIKDMIGIE